MKENIISEPNQEIFDFHHLVVFLTKVNPKTYRNMAKIYTFIIVSFDDEFNLYHSDLRHLIQILNIIFQNYTKLEYFGVSENLFFCPKMVIFAFNMN